MIAALRQRLERLRNNSAACAGADISSKIILRSAPAPESPRGLSCDAPRHRNGLRDYPATFRGAGIASGIILRPSAAPELPLGLSCDPPRRRNCLRDHSAACVGTYIAAGISSRGEAEELTAETQRAQSVRGDIGRALVCFPSFLCDLCVLCGTSAPPSSPALLFLDGLYASPVKITGPRVHLAERQSVDVLKMSVARAEREIMLDRERRDP